MRPVVRPEGSEGGPAVVLLSITVGGQEQPLDLPDIHGFRDIRTLYGILVALIFCALPFGAMFMVSPIGG